MMLLLKLYIAFSLSKEEKMLRNILTRIMRILKFFIFTQIDDIKESETGIHQSSAYLKYSDDPLTRVGYRNMLDDE